jgi:hypothetical protein
MEGYNLYRVKKEPLSPITLINWQIIFLLTKTYQLKEVYFSQNVFFYQNNWGNFCVSSVNLINFANLLEIFAKFFYVKNSKINPDLEFSGFLV